MDGLFLFFLAIFGLQHCDSTAAQHFCARLRQQSALRPATLPSAFWHQLEHLNRACSADFFLGRVRETALTAQAPFLERLERGDFRVCTEVQHSAILSATKRGTGIGPANTGSLTRLVCFAPVDFSRSSSLALPVRRSFSRVRAVCSFASTAVAPRTLPTRRSHRRGPHGRRRRAENTRARARCPPDPADAS